jgi:hypothetical protein
LPPKRAFARSLARSASTSRFRGTLVVSSEKMSLDAAAVMQRRGTNFRLRRRRLEVEQCLDVAAHDPSPFQAS